MVIKVVTHHRSVKYLDASTEHGDREAVQNAALRFIYLDCKEYGHIELKTYQVDLDTHLGINKWQASIECWKEVQ